MAKKETTMTDTANTDNQDILEQLRAQYAQFSGEEFVQPKQLSLPRANFLNDHPPKFGLFIPEESLNASGWKGEMPSLTEITYRLGNKASGLLFNADTSIPRMQIIYATPLFVELKEIRNGNKKASQEEKWKPLAERLVAEGLVPDSPALYTMKPYDIIAIFRGEEGFNSIGYEIHNILKEEGASTLARFYFFFLLDDKNEPLHNIPFCLSARGTANLHFSQQWDALVEEIEKLRCQIIGEAYNSLQERTFLFRGLCVFSPIIESVMQGEGDKSPVATVTSFVQPDLVSIQSFFLHDRVETLTEQQEFVKANSTRLFQQGGFHNLLPGAETMAALPPVDETTGEDLPSAIPAEVVHPGEW